MSVAKVPLQVLVSFVLCSLGTLVRANWSLLVEDLRKLGVLLKHVALEVDIEDAHMVRHSHLRIQLHLAHARFLEFGFST